jgi:RimJ/RimL family protein N-acetyltransferase
VGFDAHVDDGRPRGVVEVLRRHRLVPETCGVHDTYGASMDPVIRPAELSDVERIGAIHVLAWQAAYRGVMPDAFLDGLDADDRAGMWRRFLEAEPEGQHLDVVLDAGGGVAGFATYGPANDRKTGTGELYAINLDPAAWGHGLGGALLDHVAGALRDQDFGEAVLWVEPSNARARAVYERHGWSPDGAARRAEVMGATVDEVRYRSALDSTP